METIHAAHNLTIELGPTSWRLFNGVQAPDRPGGLAALVEASGSGLNCSPAFTRARQLPSPSLAPADIARVVVGWAPESRNWHLGLLLAARPENDYRMRWCGLASWPSGLAHEYSTPARLAGQSLARILNRPFHLVPAAVETAPIQADTQPIEATAQIQVAEVPRALSAIAPRMVPFTFEDWTFEAIPRGYLWQQRSRTVLLAGLRIIVLVLICGLFIVLGIGAQTSGLAAVKPAWLPWVGLAVAALVAAMAAQNAAALLTLTDVIVDVKQSEIRCRRRLTGGMRWRVPFDRVTYVLLSQTPAQDLGRAQGMTRRIASECWLHIYDGQRFYEVARLGRVEGLSHMWETVHRAQQRKGRRALVLREYDTDAHHAAVFLARLLEVDVWLDIV